MRRDSDHVITALLVGLCAGFIIGLSLGFSIRTLFFSP